MANARIPENAPPDAADVYRIAIHVCVSLGRYHLEIIKIAPGRKPALQFVQNQFLLGGQTAQTYSNKPSKNLIATKLPKSWTKSVHSMTTPPPYGNQGPQINRRLSEFVEDDIARNLYLSVISYAVSR